MSSQIPEIENSVNLLQNIIWQYDGDNPIKKILEQKEGWYTEQHAEFWDNWFRDVFDLRTANDFGLSIWARILGINLFVPECSTPLTTEQKRFVCRLRYYQLITRCTIPEVNGILKDMFTSDDGKAYALDPNDMSRIQYVFTYHPDGAVAFILKHYDLLPRPAAVGVSYRFLTYKPFGFGQHYANFRAPFWHGDGIKIYTNLKLTLTFSDGVLSGALTAAAGIVVSDIDVTLIYTLAGGATATERLVTDSNGQFSTAPDFSVGYDVVARAQVLNPLCEWENVESSLSTRIKFNGVIKFNGSNKFRG